MAPPTKKKKMSKQAKKKMMADRSKKALEQRGLGAGRRRKFALAANWKEETYKSGNRTRVKFVSPGKTTYKTQKAAGEALVARNLSDCFCEKATTTEDQNTETDSDLDINSYNKLEKKHLPHEESEAERKGLPIERRLFVCESTQIMDMVNQINSS